MKTCWLRQTGSALWTGPSVLYLSHFQLQVLTTQYVHASTSVVVVLTVFRKAVEDLLGTLLQQHFWKEPPLSPLSPFKFPLIFNKVLYGWSHIFLKKLSLA